MLKASKDILPVHYAIYERWAQSFSDEFIPDMIVYARADPTKSLDRVKIRGRESETGISLEYLTACHERHEEWIMTDHNVAKKTIVFDANEEFIGDKAVRVDELVK